MKGLSHGLSRLLVRSPLDDVQIQASSTHDEKPESRSASLVPSQFNVRLTTTDGHLAVWNSLNGAVSVFEPEQRALVRSHLAHQAGPQALSGVTKYLADRGFLVPSREGEHRRLIHLFGLQHYRSSRLELTLLASEDCNFRCRYCYEHFSRGTMLPGVREGLKVYLGLEAPRLQQLMIAWFGGEPLYGFEAIEDLAPFIVELCDEYGIDLRCNMTTNGFLLTPEYVERLLSWKITRYQVTIDGTPENHNRQRPTRDGRDSFETVLNNLKQMKKQDDDFTVIIRINFDKDNHSSVGEFLDLIASSFGGDDRFRVRFYPVGTWGSRCSDEVRAYSTSEGNLVKGELVQLARDRGMYVANEQIKPMRLGSRVCYAARPHHLAIGADGGVMKCTVALAENDRNQIGQITPERGLRLDHEKHARWTEPAFLTDEKCRRCAVLPVCFGISCPLRRVELGIRPCLAERKNLKHELQRLIRGLGLEARVVDVNCT